RDPTPGHRIGALVQHDQAIVSRPDLFPGDPPGFARARLAPRHVARVPCEAVAEGPPLDAEAHRNLALAHFPPLRLHELDHAHLPAAGDRAQRGTESRRGFPLTVSGVHDHDRVSLARAAGRTLERHLAGFQLRPGTTAAPGPST